MTEIDFVVLWVDNSDIEWRKQKEFWKNGGDYFKEASNDVRYRDWGLFKYWFRCVEKNAPWVRKIHLVTNGQVPSWLDLTNSKIELNVHDSFMAKESLPTFSSIPIELQLYKIQSLSEKFVYFNDDIFLINPVTPDFFFHEDKRADFFCERGYLRFTGTEFGKTLHNNINEINAHIANKRELIKRNIGIQKWFSPDLPLSYRLSNLINYMRTSKFVGFTVEHTAFAYTKSLMKEVWENCNDVLANSIIHKFRATSDVNQYIFRYWSLINGDYYLNPKIQGGYYTLNEADKAVQAILGNSQYPIICLNDADNVKFNEDKVELLINAFEKRFNTVSSFEK